jgi:type IV secretion system protein VirB4
VFKRPRFERLVSDHVEILDHIGEHELLLTDGSRLVIFEIEGLPAGTAPFSDINWWLERLALTLRNIASDRLELLIWDCRGLADPSAVSAVAADPCCNPLVRKLGVTYGTMLLDGRLFETRLYLGVRLLPANIAGDSVSQTIRRWFPQRQAPAADLDDMSERLAGICGQLRLELSTYRPRLLGIESTPFADFSEPAEALAFALTGMHRRVPLVAGYDEEGRETHGMLGRVIVTDTIVVGPEAVEIRGNARSMFAICYGQREYPSRTGPLMFAAFAGSSYLRTVFHSFRFYNKADGMALVSRKQNTAVAANDKAYKQIAELPVLLSELQGNELVMGMHSMVVIGFAHDMRALTEVAHTLSTDLASSGAVVIRERRALEASFFSILPGNDHLRVRPGAVSSRNFVAMAPLHGFRSGAPRRGQWGGPIAVLRTVAGTPFYFQWHPPGIGNANANTLITGVSGAGKTVLTAFLLAMTTKAAGVIALDHKHGWETLFRGMGAPYGSLGGGRPVFSALKGLDNTPQNVEFLTELLHGCIMADGQLRPDDEESRRLSLALHMVMEMPSQDRWMEDICAFIGTESGGAAARLRKWCWGEELGWVIDAPADLMDLTGDVIGHDVTDLMTNARARGPAIIYLMHRVRLRLDGRPLLIPIDEGWQIADDPVWAPLLFAQARTIRSKGGVLVFITQSPEDAAKEGVSAALLEQFPNQIHLANPQARKEHYVDAFKRTEREYEIIRKLPVGQGWALLCQGDKSDVVQLLLDGMDDFQTVLSTPEKLLTVLDRARADVGDNPALLLSEFHRRRKELVE